MNMIKDQIAESLLNLSQTALLLVSLDDGRILASNVSLSELADLNSEFLSEEYILLDRIFSDPEDFPAIASALKDSGRIKNMRTSIYGRNGIKKNVLVSAETIWYRDENCAMISFFEAKQEPYYKSIFDSLQDGIILLNNANGLEILYTNPAIEKITGCEPDNAKGNNLKDLLSSFNPDLYELVDYHIRQKIENQIEIYHSESQSWYDLNISFQQADNTTTLIFKNVTVAKDLAARLEEAGKNYLDHIESARTGIYEVDFRNKRFLKVNDAICCLTGYSRDELMSMNPFDLLDQESKKLFEKRLNQWLAGEKPEKNVDYKVIAKDGHEIYTELDVSFIRDENGQPSGAAVIGHDITKRKKSEESARQSNNLLNAVVNNTNMLMACLDKEFNFIWVNSAYALADEKEPDYFIGKNHFSLYPNEENEKIFRDTLVSGNPFIVFAKPFEYPNNPERGVTYWDWSLIPVKDEITGEACHLVFTLLNVTERKQAEYKLAHSLKKFEILSNTAGELLVASDPQKVIDTLCREVMSFLECDVFFNFMSEDSVNKLKLNAWHGIPEDEARRIEWLDYGASVCGCVAQQGQRIIAECIQITNDSRTNLVRSYGVRAYACHPLKGKEGKVIGTLSFGSKRRDSFSNDDIALMKTVADLVSVAISRKSYEEALSKSNSLLNERNMELDAFNYSASHDLKSPLRAISSFANMLMGDYSHIIDDTGRQYIDRIIKASQRMAILVEDLLKLSQVSRMDIYKTDVNLSELIENHANELCQNEPERNARLQINDNIKVKADPGLIRIAMDNLISNAWKFTSKEEEALIRFSAETDGNGILKCCVADNGVGFDMSRANNLFKPFNRLHAGNEYPGTGIGLAIVKRIIERHGGSIWAESSPGKGSSFYFTLPGSEEMEKQQ